MPDSYCLKNHIYSIITVEKNSKSEKYILDFCDSGVWVYQKI